jgi:NAD(P)H-dependent FMN reductase
MQKRPKIGIIISTTRPGRFGEVPTNWLFNIAKERNDADFEIVDLRDYPMPFFEEKVPLHVAPPQNEVALRWGEKIASLDGYIFVTAEYNHSIPAVLNGVAVTPSYGPVVKGKTIFFGSASRQSLSFVSFSVRVRTAPVSSVDGCVRMTDRARHP